MAALRIRGESSGARCRDDQRGSGTVLAAGMVVLLMAVAAAILVVGGYLVAADHARGAADLVAISAAAKVAQRGDGCRPCRRQCGAGRLDHQQHAAVDVQQFSNKARKAGGP